ncbi:trehalose operon repressor [Macrococcus hajekii]|uniref:Trehalose operon repressor n=1 Tax=Macrococcus hajekii TaxID=198482 RepID=A0A4V3BE35_9STAP|nr:trehalose operon repressor [Macrococcus hajekii]TDM02094.1 trehalose operon repressor [Macrococcus hajekii]GGB10043.1 trehalose operon repressor [Macrococcus hajekii]
MNRNKYQAIYQEISGQILQGEYEFHDQLPSESILVKHYNVSRETVRKALNLLQLNGYIQKLKGKGSVVIYQESTNFPFSKLISFEEINNSLGMDYETKVESFQRVSVSGHPLVKAALHLEDEADLYEVIRSRRKNGRVNIIDTDYFLADIVEGLTEEIAQQSIYAYIENELDLNISYSNKAITFEPMTDAELEIFGTVEPPYAATVRSIVHLSNAVPFQYNISKHRASEFKFVDFSRRNLEADK